MPGLLSAADLDRPTIDGLIAAADRFARERPSAARSGDVVALMFFEDSLRTRVGFEMAAARLGIAAVAVTGAKHTAQMATPESFEDAIRCVAPLCDAIFLRHPDAGAPARAASLVATPVVNCGNGVEEHPTQALADLYAIHRLRGRVDGVRVALVGDLRHMRTAHSLLLALGRYDDVAVRCVSPRGLEMPAVYEAAFRSGGGVLEATEAMELDDVDVVYVAGLPSTRENGVSSADQARYRIDGARAAALPASALLLCPLPRVDEIAAEVDGAPQAVYFQQNALASAMRMAVLEHVLA